MAGPNLDASQIDMLEQSGQLSPETAAQLRNLQGVSMAPQMVERPPLPPTGSVTQDAIGRQMQAALGPVQSTPDTNLQMAQADPAAFQAMNTGMQEAGLAPAALPTPLAPVAAEPPPEQVAAIEQEAATQAVAANAQAKASQAIAAQNAQEESEKAALQASADTAQEEKVKADLDETSPNWGRGIGNAIAIMLGAYSQGLTGAKENPAIVQLEKMAERQAAAKKYSDEQKLKLSELLLKQAQQEIEKRRATVDSMIGLRKLEQADQEIALKREEINAKRAQLQAAAKQIFTQAEIMSLGGEDGNRIRERAVRLPDGRYALAIGSKEAGRYREEISPNIDKSLKSLNKLESLTDYFGNNPAKKVLSRDEIGIAKQEVQNLVGSIRLEYFGPGILTDNEQEIARSMIGNPSKFFSLESANRAKLLNMAEKLKFSRRAFLRENGVDLPPSRNERVLEQAMQKFPNTPKAELINALIQQGHWDRNEQ